MADLPEVCRVSYADHASKAAALLVSSDNAGRVAAEACRLVPLQKIQTLFDQLTNHADGRRRGEPWPYDHDFASYAQAEIEGAKRHLEVLSVAANAAETMIEEMAEQISSLLAATSENADAAKASDSKPDARRQSRR